MGREIWKNSHFDYIYYTHLPGHVNPPIDKVETLAKALNIDINKLIKSNATIIKNKTDFLNFDNRTLSKFKLILSLDKNERHLVYSYIDSLVNKRKKKQKQLAETTKWA